MKKFVYGVSYARLYEHLNTDLISNSLIGQYGTRADWSMVCEAQAIR